jgi:hypothetical protein
MKLENPRSLLYGSKHPTFALKKILVPQDFSPTFPKSFQVRMSLCKGVWFTPNFAPRARASFVAKLYETAWGGGPDFRTE